MGQYHKDAQLRVLVGAATSFTLEKSVLKFESKIFLVDFKGQAE